MPLGINSDRSLFFQPQTQWPSISLRSGLPCFFFLLGESGQCHFINFYLMVMISTPLTIVLRLEPLVLSSFRRFVVINSLYIFMESIRNNFAQAFEYPNDCSKIQEMKKGPQERFHRSDYFLSISLFGLFFIQSSSRLTTAESVTNLIFFPFQNCY